MRIILIENSNQVYDGYSRNSSKLRGAELAIINYSEELVKKNFFFKKDWYAHFIIIDKEVNFVCYE